MDIPQTGMPSFSVPKNTHTIGILISDLGNYFWGELVNSIIKHFTDHGYTVIVCSFFFEHQKEIDTIQDIISQHFDGVIMLPSCWHDDLYQLLRMPAYRL